jgi:hypothetical protein
MNRTIWLAADEAGFSRIAHGQYAIFIALRLYCPKTEMIKMQAHWNERKNKSRRSRYPRMKYQEADKDMVERYEQHT